MVDILSPLPGERPVPLLSAVSDGPDPAAPVSPAPPKPASAPELPPAAPAVVEGVESAAPEPPEPEAPEEPPETPPEPPGETRATRFAEYAKRARAAEERADRLARSLEQAIGALDRQTRPPEEKPPEAPAPIPRPARDAYDGPDAYEAAVIEWASGNAVRAAWAEWEARQTQTTQQQEQQRQQQAENERQRAIHEAYATRHAAAMQKYPDWDEVVQTNETVRISDPMREAILMAEDGPDLAYHLGKHPDDAARIFALPPVQQIIEMGKLSAKLAAPAPPVRAPTAPPPIRPVGNNTGNSERPLEELTTEEYAARRMPRLQAERRAGMLGQRL